ncbi:hypothetical protein HD806DRAFT_487168 [Xylariaceae sp. AK1471]|nr:hypothetical protein HD806DRAFT_487168 [Xylariaceae sp. AK1471]
MTTIHTPVLATSSIAYHLAGTGGLPVLLTVFTPPSYCSLRWFYDPETPGSAFSNSKYDNIWSYCQPYSTNNWYSPGVCPSGQEFKDVTKYLADQGHGTTDTTYQGHCCGIGFTPSYTTSVETLSQYSKTVTYTDSTCLSYFEPPVTLMLMQKSGDMDSLTQTVLSSRIVAVGTNLDMLWHSSDLTLYPESLAASLRVGMGLPAFPTTSTAAMPTESSTAQLPMPTSNDPGPGNPSAYLSKGAIAGISIGVAFVVLLIGTLGYLAFSRRWKKQAPEVEQQGNDSSTRNSNKFIRLSWIARWKKDTTLPDLPEMDQGQNVYKHFSGGAWRAELHSRNPSDGSQFDPRFSHYSGSTAVVGAPMELEGSVPVRQETIPEVREDH